jgi:transcriptional regulator with XRE-family HTH domain
MAASRGSRELARLLERRGAQQELAGKMGTFPSVVLRWRRGDQKPEGTNRKSLEDELGIPWTWWDEPAEEASSGDAA